MAKKIDVQKQAKKIWKQTSQRLSKLGHETIKLARRGEKEVVRASEIGGLQLDIVGINLRKEKLYRDIGKKVVELNYKRKMNIPAIKNFSNQVRSLDLLLQRKKRKIAQEKKKKIK